MVARKLGSFYAQSEAGKMYEVIEWEDEVAFRPLKGGSKVMAGPISYRLADGRDVTTVEGDPNAFQILDTDEIIRKR